MIAKLLHWKEFHWQRNLRRAFRIRRPPLSPSYYEKDDEGFKDRLLHWAGNRFGRASVLYAVIDETEYEACIPFQARLLKEVLRRFWFVKNRRTFNRSTT
jgi:hypothetical protein